MNLGTLNFCNVSEPSLKLDKYFRHCNTKNENAFAKPYSHFTTADIDQPATPGNMDLTRNSGAGGWCSIKEMK